MNTRLFCSSLLLGTALLSACGDKDDTSAIDDTGGLDTDAGSVDPVVAPTTTQDLQVGDVVTYTLSNLTAGQAYRVTLVSDANITVADGSGLFVDLDANGAADAGDSTQVAAIVGVNGDAYDGSKTVPGTDDDPTQPSGVFAIDGEITVDVAAVGAGRAWLVAYENGGISTFLEIDDAGVPTEPHGVGGAIAVAADGMPDVTPTYPRSIAIDEVTTYAITDLDDSQAYRVTLVVAANITLSGSGSSGALFLDADANGAADAGASEAVGLLTAVQGEAITGAKTWPAGTDDPAAPSGIYPVNGRIVIEVTGVGAGAILPVAYENGGASTFLELDGTGAPIEAYGIGGALTVVP